MDIVLGFLYLVSGLCVDLPQTVGGRRFGALGGGRPDARSMTASFSASMAQTRWSRRAAQ
jgi:hypothetical protein